MKTRSKVVVISENYRLSNHIRSCFYENGLDRDFSLHFFCSPRSKAHIEIAQLGGVEIDLRSTADLQWILREASLVISAHCAQIFPAILINSVTCINIHPGFNPYNRGWYPQVFSILNGLPIGATIHVMDEEIDHGPIIAQRRVVMEDGDTSFELYGKILGVEEELISENISSILHRNYVPFLADGDGNYNSRLDFNRLCQLDLQSVGTLGEHISLLRALSHNGFDNATFAGVNGERYSISLLIKKRQS